MKEKTKKEKWNLIWFLTALISSWLTFLFVFTIPFGFLLWLVVLILLFIRKTKLKWFLIVFSAWTLVPAYSFLSGTIDYFSGKATLKYIGEPEPAFFNLDRNYRAWNSTSGCVVFGYEPLIHGPNNAAVQLWTTMLGFQKDVYKGYYPDEKQTDSLLSITAQTTTFVKNEFRLNFKLNGKNYQIVETSHQDMQSLDSITLAKVSLFNKELIIFKPEIPGDETVTYLADYTTGKIFARYYAYHADTVGR